jgi:AmpD protein
MTGTRSISDAGWHGRARHVPSVNWDARPASTAVQLIVIHNISLPPGNFGGDAVERLFTNRLDPDAHPYFAGIAHMKVSAHFLVSRAGVLTQFVSANHRAWHAGVSEWRTRRRCNDFSVGIELEGTDRQAYTARQYRCLGALARTLVKRYPSIAGVAGHSEIAPGRKTDPGPAFDWGRFMRESGLPQGFRKLS